GTWPARLDVTGRTVTLAGAGRDATVLDGEGLGAVISAEGEVDLVVRDLAIEGGLTGRGGGLRLVAPIVDGAPRGLLTLERVALRYNDAVDGGGAWLEGLVATLDRVEVADNVAGRLGGGLYLETCDTVL